MVDIMQLNHEATKALEKDKHTINASIGMFYNEDKHILSMESIKHYLKQVDLQTWMPYNSITGGTTYHQTLRHWIFNEKHPLSKDFYLRTCATPGGSGAISAIFNLYGHDGDHILVSDIRWQYERFATSAKKQILEHQLFNENGFNLDDFTTKLHHLAKKQKTIIVVINDPCHNPTGYSMTTDEIKNIIEILNTYASSEIVLLYDLAYLDFETREDAREKISLFNTLNPHVLTVLAFSGSKTLGLYGFRVGAAIGLSKNEDSVNHFYEKLKDYAIGNWSSTSTPGIEIINHVMAHDALDLFKHDLSIIKDIMRKRATIFLNEALHVGLSIYPYKSGFYALIKSDQPLRDFNKLKANNIFVVPHEFGLRVALCSINLNEITGLATRIKNILSEV